MTNAEELQAPISCKANRENEIPGNIRYLLNADTHAETPQDSRARLAATLPCVTLKQSKDSLEPITDSATASQIGRSWTYTVVFAALC